MLQYRHKVTREQTTVNPAMNLYGDAAIEAMKDWDIITDDSFPPKFLSQAVEEAASRIRRAAASAYVGGFYSTASGERMYYDSDQEAQSLISNVYNRTKETDWETKVRYPGLAPAGYAPIRARPSNESDESSKVIKILSATQLKQLMDDMDDAFYTIKGKVWKKQAEILAIVEDNVLYDTEEKKVNAIDAVAW